MNTEHRTTQYAVRTTYNANGFSLMEVLLAVGILAVGMLFIAGVFPVGIHFTTVSTERTMAAIVADEAFAKIKLLGFTDANWSPIGQAPFEFVATTRPATDYFAYPSTHTNFMQKKYFWSAICRMVGPQDVQVTVFVIKKVGQTPRYIGFDPNRPNAVTVPVTFNAGILQITDSSRKSYINDGYTVVDEAGHIYRVLERYGTNYDLLRLNETWQGGATDLLWVVTPPGTGITFVPNGKYPCIAVYQKVMRF